MPTCGHTIKSEQSGSNTAAESGGGRKVVLWSRFGWRNVDTLGSPHLPEGRYIRAETEVAGQTWTIIDMCIPYHAYRTGDKWGDKRMKAWEGACRYLDSFARGYPATIEAARAHRPHGRLQLANSAEKLPVSRQRG